MDAVVISKLVVENFVTPKWLFLVKNGRKIHFFLKNGNIYSVLHCKKLTVNFTVKYLAAGLPTFYRNFYGLP